MSTDSVAYTYAMAVSQIEGIDLKKIETEMDLVAELFKNSEIRAYFESPAIPIAAKKEKLKSTLGKHVSPVVLNFLNLVLDKHREVYISEICAALTEISDEKFNRVRPHIILSRAYPENELKEILSMIDDLVSTRRKDFGLENSIGNLEFIPEVEVQPGLLGGIYMRVGDYVWDSSIDRFLKDWRRRVLSGTVDQDAAISE